jgi:lipopolysaccharide export system permease protein
MIAMFLLCCVLIFFVDFIEMLRRAGNYSGDVPGLLLAWITLLRPPLVLGADPPLRSADRHHRHLPHAEPILGTRRVARRWHFGVAVHAAGDDRCLSARCRFVLFYNPVAAAARAQAEELYAAAFGRDDSLLKTNKNAGAWLREDGTDGPSVVHALEVLNQGLELNGVTLFQYDRDNGLSERIEAKHALLKDGRWELQDAWVSSRGSGARALQGISGQHLSHASAGAR